MKKPYCNNCIQQPCRIDKRRKIQYQKKEKDGEHLKEDWRVECRQNADYLKTPYLKLGVTVNHLSVAAFERFKRPTWVNSKIQEILKLRRHPSWQWRPTASWVVLGKALPAGRGRWSFSSTQVEATLACWVQFIRKYRLNEASSVKGHEYDEGTGASFIWGENRRPGTV